MLNSLFGGKNCGPSLMGGGNEDGPEVMTKDELLKENARLRKLVDHFNPVKEIKSLPMPGSVRWDDDDDNCVKPTPTPEADKALKEQIESDKAKEKDLQINTCTKMKDVLHDVNESIMRVELHIAAAPKSSTTLADDVKQTSADLAAAREEMNRQFEVILQMSPLQEQLDATKHLHENVIWQLEQTTKFVKSTAQSADEADEAGEEEGEDEGVEEESEAEAELRVITVRLKGAEPGQLLDEVRLEVAETTTVDDLANLLGEAWCEMLDEAGEVPEYFPKGSFEVTLLTRDHKELGSSLVLSECAKDDPNFWGETTEGNGAAHGIQAVATDVTAP